MFELIPEDIFADLLHSHLNVLHELYIKDKTPEILEELRRTFDFAYDTCFLIIDSETGTPMTKEVLTDRKPADECARVCGPDVSVGILLIGR